MEGVGKCVITYFRQHEAMVEAGTSKGVRESARKIAEDTGESAETVRNRIRRGKRDVGQYDQACLSNAREVTGVG